jgi:hypothetical protein
MEALRQDLRQDLTAQTAKFKENLTNLADINKADFQALKTSTEEKINVYNKEVDGKVANLANEVSKVSNRQGSENLISTAQQQERGGCYSWSCCQSVRSQVCSRNSSYSSNGKPN